MTTPSPGMLWHQARQDPERYRSLLREHGLIVPCECACHPGPHCDRCKPSLPCGWQPGKRREEQDRCDVTDLLRASCAHCRGISDEPEPERGEAGPAFAARYPGKCSGCGDPINEGDRIRADGAGGYEHEGCSP